MDCRFDNHGEVQESSTNIQRLKTTVATHPIKLPANTITARPKFNRLHCSSNFLVSTSLTEALSPSLAFAISLSLIPRIVAMVYGTMAGTISVAATYNVRAFSGDSERPRSAGEMLGAKKYQDTELQHREAKIDETDTVMQGNQSSKRRLWRRAARWRCRCRRYVSRLWQPVLAAVRKERGWRRRTLRLLDLHASSVLACPIIASARWMDYQ